MSRQGESTPTSVLTVPSPSKNPAISCGISESTLGKNHSLAISAVDPLLSNPLLTVTWKPMGPVSCNEQRFECICVVGHFDGDWNLFQYSLCLVFMLRVKILILSVRNECSSREKYFIKICAIFQTWKNSAATFVAPDFRPREAWKSTCVSTLEPSLSSALTVICGSGPQGIVRAT